MFGQVRYDKEIFKKLTKVKPARLKLWAFLFYEKNTLPTPKRILRRNTTKPKN